MCQVDKWSQTYHVIPLHISRWQQVANCFGLWDKRISEAWMRRVSVTVSSCAVASETIQCQWWRWKDANSKLGPVQNSDQDERPSLSRGQEKAKSSSKVCGTRLYSESYRSFGCTFTKDAMKPTPLCLVKSNPKVLRPQVSLNAISKWNTLWFKTRMQTILFACVSTHRNPETFMRKTRKVNGRAHKAS